MREQARNNDALMDDINQNDARLYRTPVLSDGGELTKEESLQITKDYLSKITLSRWGEYATGAAMGNFDKPATDMNDLVSQICKRGVSKKLTQVLTENAPYFLGAIALTALGTYYLAKKAKRRGKS